MKVNLYLDCSSEGLKIISIKAIVQMKLRSHAKTPWNASDVKCCKILALYEVSPWSIFFFLSWFNQNVPEEFFFLLVQQNCCSHFALQCNATSQESIVPSIVAISRICQNILSDIKGNNAVVELTNAFQVPWGSNRKPAGMGTYIPVFWAILFYFYLLIYWGEAPNGYYSVDGSLARISPFTLMEFVV